MSLMADLAAQYGTTVPDIIEDYGNLAYTLAEATFVGEVAVALGLPQGQVLIDNSASVLASATEELGLDIDAEGPVISETGAAAALVSRAASYLAKGAAGVAKTVSKHSGGIVAAILAIGLVTTGYSYFTEDLQVRLAQVEANKEATSKAIAKANPEQLQGLLQQMDTGFTLPWWGWGLIIVGGGALAWRQWGR